MSTYSPTSPAANRSSQRKLPSAAYRGLGILASLSLVAGAAAAQTTDAMSVSTDPGRMALAFGVLSAIVLVKVWAYADKRSKLMDRLTGFLASRAAERARHATVRAQDDAAKADDCGSAQYPQGLTTSAAAASPASHATVHGSVQPDKIIHVLPVPGLPTRMQYLSD